MKATPSTCSLFHELFATDWANDDPEYCEELKQYETAIKRLLSIDSNLTTFIKTQPVLDYDQLSYVPVVSSTEKTAFVFSIEQKSVKVDFKIKSSDSNIFSVFKRIDVECRQNCNTYNNSSNIDLVLEDSINPSDSSFVRFTCFWCQPLAELSPPLAKFMGQQVAMPGLVSLKLLSHINSKDLNKNGEIKCDTLLKGIFGVESIKMDMFGQLVNEKMCPLKPLVIELQLPADKKAVCIQYPVMSVDNAGQFRPIDVEPAPVKELLEECVKAKEKIECANDFLRDPIAFTDNEVELASRETDLPELYTSTYLYDQPWVVETGEQYLKTLAYKKSGRK